MFGASPSDHNDAFDPSLLSNRLLGVAEYVGEIFSNIVLGYLII